MPTEFLHLLQQTLNALQVSAFYALLAVAYVLLHGVSNRFNLSFGAVATWAGYVAIGAALTLSQTTFWETPLILAAAFGGSLIAGGALGALIGRAIVVPLMRAPALAALVATIGLALALQETMRLATDSRDFWLQPLYADPLLDLGRSEYPIRVSLMQAMTLTASLVLACSIGAAMRLSRFGREWRACSDDPRMVALMGVDVPRLVAFAGIASCATAAATGFLIAAHYGNVSFSSGFVLAMKALLVAIVGGLSSFRGAAVGGFVLGFAETGWSAFFPIEYRDVAVLTALTGLVVLGRRPQEAP